jgi:hypothetical protein
MTTNTYRTNDNRHTVVEDIEAGESRSIPFLSRSAMTKSFQASSLGLGCVVGSLAEISTLGIINSQLALSWNHTLLTFSVPIVMITMTLSILYLLRHLLTISHEMGRRRNIKEDGFVTDDTRDNDAFQDLLLELEKRFVGGAVIGLCGAWIATGCLF